MIRQNIFPFILILGISIIPIISIHFPRMLSFAPLLIGVLMSIWWVFIKKERLNHCKSYMYCIIAICAFIIISTLWSIEPVQAYERSLKTSIILLFSIPLFDLARTINNKKIKKYSWIFPVSIMIGALLCSFELAFDMPIYKAIRGIDADADISSAVMNRGVVCIIFAYFTSFLFIRNIDSQKLKISLIIAMSISVLLMLSLTQSQSGQLAFALGMITLLFIPHRYKFIHKAIALFIVIILLFTPWIVGMLFDLLIDNAQELPWLKDAYAGNRVEIWDFVMNYALNNPLYGYGFNATRFVENFDHGYIYHKGPTVLHPHNFAVQIWIEFGIIGVFLTGALIYFIMSKISNLTVTDKKIITSVVIAVLSVAAAGYDLWQSWWIGELVFISALCALTIKPQKQSFIT